MSILQEKFEPPAFIKLEEEIEPLQRRLNFGAAGETPPRIVTFIAARSEEGTSTVAWNYAGSLVRSGYSRTLLLRDTVTALPAAASATSGIVEQAAEGRPLADAVAPLPQGFYLAYWVIDSSYRIQAAKLMQTPGLWHELLEQFDRIVIDAPALKTSYGGIMLAGHSDATVMVIEAENTPMAVVENLRDTLLGVGAKIAGIVMNKRNYHIPERVYRKL